jgi:pimeloyl-ACP methyl ester carboxylesterase
MQVITDGLLTHYETSGKGKTVIMLHGWGDNLSLKNLQTALSKKFHVVRPDLPGFGASQAPPAAWGLSDYALFISHFLQKINCSQPLAMIGHSNGGAIILRGVGENLLSADKLVLLASSGIRSQDRTKKSVLKFIAKTGKTLTFPLPHKLKQQLRGRFYTQIQSDMLAVEGMQATFKKIVSDDVQNDAQKISTPTLLIYGENDDQTPIEFGEQFHQLIDNSSLEVLTNAGHFVHIDQPIKTEKAVEDFLDD